MSVDVALSRPKAQQDLRVFNNATLTMAIADLFHAENLSDTVVESVRFRRVLELSRLVGVDYRPPNRRDIGGPLLDENCNQYKKGNFGAAIKDSGTFGFTWLGDGTTVKTKPLLNCSTMHGNCYPVVAAIRDCSDHLAEGGTKNALYIANIFGELVEKYDPKHTDTDIFYFDGASNVQKAGRVLEVWYPAP